MNRTYKRQAITASLVATGLLLAGCSSPGSSDASVDDTLDIAWASSPATIVPSESTANAARDIGLNIFEGLVAFDADYAIQPMLASTWEVGEDGQSVTFTLREDATFHNGDAVTAADVISSIEYWRTRSAVAVQFFDELTVTEEGQQVTLSTPEPQPILDVVATMVQPLVIMPASIVDAVPEGGAVDEYIGTGPYLYSDWQQDQYIELTRYEDYVGVESPASGYSGGKAAEIENLKFWIVPDSSARVSGLRSGQYDAADQIQPDDLPQIDSDEFTKLISTETFSILYLNHAEGPMTDLALRKALYAAIDIETVERATYSDPELYSIDGALAPAGSPFHTEEGLGDWNAADLDMAAGYLEDSSYDGTPIRIIASQDYPQVYNYAIVVQETLKDLGIESEITTAPWSSFLEMRADSTQWDISFTTAFSLSTLPSTYGFFSSVYPGWIDSPEISAALEQVNRAQTDDEKVAAARALNEANASYVGYIKAANEASITAANSNLVGLEYLTGPIYWNATFQDGE